MSLVIDRGGEREYSPRFYRFVTFGVIMSLFVVSQILVGFAICTDLLSFQFKQRKHIVSCLLVSCTLISIHFMCLGQRTAAYMGLLAAARFITCVFTTDKIVRTLFVFATLVVSFVTYEGLLSVLCTAGGLFGIYASFCEDDKPLRQLMAIGTSIWLLHNFLAGSPGAVVMEILFLGSNIVGYFRYYIRPRKQALGRSFQVCHWQVIGKSNRSAQTYRKQIFVLVAVLVIVAGTVTQHARKFRVTINRTTCISQLNNYSIRIYIVLSQVMVCSPCISRGAARSMRMCC